MNKIFTLLTLLCICTLASSAIYGAPGNYPINDSLAEFIDSCSQVNYIPLDQDHRRFITNCLKTKCLPIPSFQVQPFSVQYAALETLRVCAAGCSLSGTSALVKKQFADTVQCAYEAIQFQEQWQNSLISKNQKMQSKDQGMKLRKQKYSKIH